MHLSLESCRTRVFPEPRSAVLALCACLLSVLGGIASARAEISRAGSWNGFSEHLVVAECVSGVDHGLSVVLEARSNESEVLGSDSYYLPPRGSHHTILNQFPIRDRYGTFTVRGADGSSLDDAVACVAMHYRLTPNGSEKPVEYAFGIPLLSGTNQPASGIFNSYHPGGAPLATWNWLTVINVGSHPLNAFVEVYRQDGSFDAASSFSVDALPPGARRDFALGHPGGQTAGIYRIVPASSSDRYAAFVSRYGRFAEDRFLFGFITRPRAASCDPGPVSASTMDPAINWGEVANPTPYTFDVDLEIRDTWGNLRSSQRVALPPFSQKHVLINSILGDRALGTFRVKCAPGSPADAGVLVQSAYYGFRPPNRGFITWAYISQAGGERGGEADRMIAPANTFMRAANWTKAVEQAGLGAIADFAFHGQDGRPRGRRSYVLASRGSLDVAAHERLGFDTVGQASFVARHDSVSVEGELLRVYPSTVDRIGYIASIPAQRIPAPARDRGAVRSMPDRHSLRFRGKKTIIVGESVTQGWMEMGTDLDHLAYLDQLHRRGVNAFMIWSYIGITNQPADPRIGYEAPEIWPWRETTGRPVPPYRFEFVDGAGNAVFNERYFQRLRELVQLANDRDMIVVITIHDGWTKGRFAGHPFNTVNGGTIPTNNLYVALARYGEEMPEALSPTANPLERHQFLLERFTDRIVLETADFPNVMYEVLNEGEWYDTTLARAFNQHFARFLKSRTSQPVMVNDDHVGGEDFWGEASVDVLTMHQPTWDQSTHVSKAFLHYEPRYYNSGSDLVKPLFFTEPVPEYLGGSAANREALMRLMWGTILADTSFVMPDDSMWRWSYSSTDPLIDISGHAARFMNGMGIDLEGMQPDVEVSSSKVVLTKPGVRYLIYSQTTGTSFVDLGGASGNFRVRFYDPRTGEFHPQSVVIPGGNEETQINKPSATDWVIWLELEQ